MRSKSRSNARIPLKMDEVVGVDTRREYLFAQKLVGRDSIRNSVYGLIETVGSCGLEEKAKAFATI